MKYLTEMCEKCNGIGQVYAIPAEVECPQCEGKGIVMTEKGSHVYEFFIAFLLPEIKKSLQVEFK